MNSKQLAALLTALGGPAGVTGERLKAAMRSYERAILNGRKSFTFSDWLDDFMAGRA